MTGTQSPPRLLTSQAALSGMIANADAGLRWLIARRPISTKRRRHSKRIVADGHRAGAVIESIRATSRRTPAQNSLDINELIGKPRLERAICKGTGYW